jgi:hypothetical protein
MTVMWADSLSLRARAAKEAPAATPPMTRMFVGFMNFTFLKRMKTK